MEKEEEKKQEKKCKFDLRVHWEEDFTMQIEVENLSVSSISEVMDEIKKRVLVTAIEQHCKKLFT